jgi:Na+/H+-dicarboxylate symporter
MLAALLNLSYLEKASSALHVIFFFYIVFRLIMQIAGKKEVDRLIILESVNGYLLIGLLFSVVINEIYAIDNTTFSYSQSDPDQSGTTPNLNIFIYFTLVTMTTLGYGDIVPVKPLTKSLATIIAVVGQFYIAVIVAMLVGKYVSKN